MSPDLARAWVEIQKMLPPDDIALVKEVRPVRAADLQNIYGLVVPCAEADVETGVIKVADCEGCVHSPYIEQVLAHEVGHLRAWVDSRDLSEPAAERYVAAHWPQDVALAWQPKVDA